MGGRIDPGLALGDPGVKGKKLSKSDDDTLERRNKSYEKVLDLQIAWIKAHQAGDPVEDKIILLGKYRSKSEWHEKEFGW